RVDGRDFQRRDGSDFAQILALLIAKVSVFQRWNLSYFAAASRRDPESRRRNVTFRLDPTNDLLGIDIERVRFHLGSPDQSSGTINLANSARWPHCRTVRPEIAGPVPPARRAGVSPGVLGQEGHGSFRH